MAVCPGIHALVSLEKREKNVKVKQLKFHIQGRYFICRRLGKTKQIMRNPTAVGAKK